MRRGDGVAQRTDAIDGAAQHVLASERCESLLEELLHEGLDGEAAMLGFLLNLWADFKGNLHETASRRVHRAGSRKVESARGILRGESLPPIPASR